MLAEGFLRQLSFREERKFASSSKHKRWQTDSHCPDSLNRDLTQPSSADLQVHSAPTGPNPEDPDCVPVPVPGLRASPQGPAGLSIPGFLPLLSPPAVGVEDCSLLDQYPDLQVADSGRISHNLPRINSGGQRETHHQHPVSIPDQGYLVMGASVNLSLDLPGSGLEPMSNSLLNGLLEKQLEEVYMQHLTDNLARYNPHQGNSLLHGLVPPLGSRGRDDSLEASQEEEGGSGGSEEKISYYNTHNLVPCSSNFSTPVLRISECVNPPLQ